MATRSSTSFWIDVLSLIVMFGLAATGELICFVLPAGTGHSHVLLGWNRHDIGQLHSFLAVAALVLLAVHVWLHWSWICCIIAKMGGKPPPSHKSQTIWGLCVLVLLAVLLGGGLLCASALVQKTEHERGRRSRRTNLQRHAPEGNGSPLGAVRESRHSSAF